MGFHDKSFFPKPASFGLIIECRWPKSTAFNIMEQAF